MSMSKLYELEQLVATNGDPERIAALRKELDISPKVRGKKKREQLTPEKYLELKAERITDREIMRMYSLWFDKLTEWKVANGLGDVRIRCKRTTMILWQKENYHYGRFKKFMVVIKPLENGQWYVLLQNPMLKIKYNSIDDATFDTLDDAIAYSIKWINRAISKEKVKE